MTLKSFAETHDGLVETVLAQLIERSGRVPHPASAVMPVGSEQLCAQETDTGLDRTPSQLTEERAINSGGSRLSSLTQALNDNRKALRHAEATELQILKVL
jgi:hypothetical protein